MTQTVTLFTEFAPAERVSDEKIEVQNQYFLDIPLLHQIFDAVPDIILILNEHRQIVFANSALSKALGLKEVREAYGLRPGELLNCAHAYKNAAGCGTTEFCKNCGAVQAILLSLQGQTAIRECRITQQSGEALDLQVSTNPITVNDEQFLVFALKDISDQKRRRTLERIFFHDLLNMVGGLQGFTEFLREVHQNGQLNSVELDYILDSVHKCLY